MSGENSESSSPIGSPGGPGSPGSTEVTHTFESQGAASKKRTVRPRDPVQGSAAGDDVAALRKENEELRLRIEALEAKQQLSNSIKKNHHSTPPSASEDATHKLRIIRAINAAAQEIDGICADVVADSVTLASSSGVENAMARLSCSTERFHEAFNIFNRNKDSHDQVKKSVTSPNVSTASTGSATNKSSPGSSVRQMAKNPQPPAIVDKMVLEYLDRGVQVPTNFGRVKETNTGGNQIGNPSFDFQKADQENRKGHVFSFGTKSISLTPRLENLVVGHAGGTMYFDEFCTHYTEEENRKLQRQSKARQSIGK